MDESIECWTLCVTLNFDLTYDFGIKFWDIQFQILK